METEITNPNNMLKAERTLIDIQTEIEELKSVLGCYNHFLASYGSSQMKVAYVQVQINKAIINKSINELHLEIDEAKAGLMEQFKIPVTVRRVYDASPQEQQAIKNFNSDKRFTITE